MSEDEIICLCGRKFTMKRWVFTGYKLGHLGCKNKISERQGKWYMECM